MASSTARRSLFRHPNYLRLWTAASVSLFGTQISQIAIPFIAAVVLNAPAGEVGLLTTIEFLPFLLFTLPAGVWVDRFPKKRILVLGDLGRAVMLLSIPIAYALGVLTIWQLYVVGFVNGLMTVFFDVADQSYLPVILDRDELVEGNSKLQLSQSAAQILGQPIGGGFVALLGAPVAVLVDSVSYVASAGLIVSIRERLRRRGDDPSADAAASGIEPRQAPPGLGEPAPTPFAEGTFIAETSVAGTGVADTQEWDGGEDAAAAAPATPPGGMGRQIRDGLRFILRHEYLGNIAATTATSNLFTNIGAAIFPVFAYKVLLLTPAAVGTIGGLAGAGVLVGALITSRIQARLGVGWTIVLSAMTFGPIGLLVPLANHDTAFWLLSASFFLGSLNNVVYNVSQVSLRQAITPEHFLGRMNATMRFLVWGTIPIGSLIGAALSEIVGVTTTVWISAILATFTFLPVFLSSVRRVRVIPTGDPEAAGSAA